MVQSVRVEQHDDFLRIFVDGDYYDFHYFWLRHNCTCLKGCRHSTTKERIIDSTEVPMDIRPESVSLVNEGVDPQVKLIWKTADNHETVLDAAFLVENHYAKNRSEIPPPISDTQKLCVDYSEMLRLYAKEGSTSLSEEGTVVYRRALAERLREFGAVVVLNRGLDTEEVISDLIPGGCEVISTHFGRIEDLRTDNTTNKNTDQLGYTNSGVDLHTDQPFIENPPGMQALHCITPADVGGENYLVNGVQAARYLKQQDPVAYDMLTTVPVRFHRKQSQFESLQVRPIIELDQMSGEMKQIRYSYFTYAPHIAVPFEKMALWYKAYNTFSSMVRNPANQLRFTLKSGDFVLYDNWRMLHARTAFSGPRHMRGVYFNSEDVFRHLDA